MLHKDFESKCSVGKKIAGREIQGVVAKIDWQ
jgi:hypothetical protein